MFDSSDRRPRDRTAEAGSLALSAVLASGLLALLAWAGNQAKDSLAPMVEDPLPVLFEALQDPPGGGGGPVAVELLPSTRPAPAPAPPVVAPPAHPPPSAPEPQPTETADPAEAPTDHSAIADNAITDPGPAPGGGGGLGPGSGPGKGPGVGPGTGLGAGDGGPLRTVRFDELRVRRRLMPLLPSSAAGLPEDRYRCVAAITIDHRGKPTAVTVSDCPDLFHNETRRAARGWRFVPYKVNGVPVPARFELGVTYKVR